ncbi:GH36-type glycosyl hydrolase domain-containing protein [Jeotgalibacillus malaysiensis]|uniref:GH36-type glycosyl hydrolase domain-containing protein n=1 Tax=Jeotgalibacillus malaysiensis TaxID=1508404 RepID=UPI00384AAEEC
MTTHSQVHPLTLERNQLRFDYLQTGDIFQITHQQTMINQLIGNIYDGSLNQIYLRIHENDQIRYYPLTGKEADSTFSTSSSKAKWTGRVEGIQYDITFHLSDQLIWFWEISLSGADKTVDVVHGQDIGIADRNAVRTNEAYTSQYIDHAVFEDEESGYLICSRQNQPQQNKFPALQIGSLGKSTGYSTDGFQFFGLSFKETDTPEVLTKPSLENKVYQYEFAYAALQSETVLLDGAADFVFYGAFTEDHPEAVQRPIFNDEISDVWYSVQAEEADFSIAERAQSETATATLTSENISIDEINEWYPERLEEEWKDGQLLSFFTLDYEHIVLKQKELLTERSHGHILMSGNNHQLKGQPVMASTAYMPGVFNAQTVLGNTNMNKLLSNVRNPLNIFKSSGQRIRIKVDNEFRLLTMPAVFEMGFNYAKWIYKYNGDIIDIRSFSHKDDKTITLEVTSRNKVSYEWIVSNQLSMNTQEYDVPYHLEKHDHSFIVTADQASDSANTHPNLAYKLSLNGTSCSLKERAASIIELSLSKTDKWSMQIAGSLDKKFHVNDHQHFTETKLAYYEYYKQLLKGFSLSHKEQNVEKVNILSWWYTHNMLVHYSSPHGLEQYGGAAWGTRDVCQGPTEYFMATREYASVKEIIKTVYEHQYDETGDWPQWFMFDEYSRIQQDHSHGDVIVWPLKVVADYITATGDDDILDMKIPYTSRINFSFTDEQYTLKHHIEKQITTIKQNFLHGTHLSSYGDGDWDDTLQPANEQLRQYMVSSWTVALTYQTVRTLGSALSKNHPAESSELASLAESIKADFMTYMLKTEVIPGFLYFEDPANPENMVHPDDKTTGINYRLLPMTRSMISELLSAEDMERHYALIREKFYCPDGVRLMNKPAQYEGGVSKNFKRAEQASNFGREIGLQYVHAHIRFVEAMAKIGEKNEVWKGLETINPVGITSVVPNAEIRQSNAYFSSSDGKFNTRYEAQEHFDKLRSGDVSVKGGWRIYSSGPGIYMNQLISNALGLREEDGATIFDPILPDELNGLTLTFDILGKPALIRYHLGEENQKLIINGTQAKTEELINPYRKGGLRVDSHEAEKLLKASDNVIDVYK